VDFLSDQELVRITQLAMADKKRLAEEQASNKLVARENRKRLAQERAHNRLVAKERAHEKRLARQTARNNQLAEAEKRRLARVKKEPHQAQQSSATNKDMMIEKKNAGSSSISNPTGISGRGRSKRWMVEMNKALSLMIHQRQMKKKELKSLLIAKKEKKKEAVGKKKSNEQQLQSSTQHERDLHERDQHEACSELHNIRNNKANNGEQDVEKPSDKYEEQDQFKGIKRLVEENPQPLT
jgi:hypothetical protein